MNESEEPAIPSPSLFTSLVPYENQRDRNALPTVGQCAVHLELLEVFFALRSKIINSTQLDNTFGIKINNGIVHRKEYDRRKRKYIYKPYKLRDNTWQARRREKWSYFLSIAVQRFKMWIRKANDTVDGSGLSENTRLPFLPPLDVLMVWHACLLNPVDFDYYCRKNGLKGIRQLSFPWAEIHRAINANDWTYSLANASSDWTRVTVNMHPDLVQYLELMGRTANPVSRVLSRYGDRSVTFGSLSPEVRYLADSEKSFLNILLELDVQKSQNQPLVDNVQRQAAFVDKMHRHLWICSPAAEGTLRRALGRYDKFLKLFKFYPGKMMVPTLDIDLVWHTHQCSAAQYEESMRERTGRFINHDDKIGQPVLDGAMAETRQLFIIRFGQEYSTCLCWDCEATASILEQIDENGGLDGADMDALAELVRQDVGYYRAVELARQNGQERPRRQ
ncbi:hypothetical protein Asppvi_005893 [Aspergillus pseudoviridinutans]|uniref:Uncharacterized protein n=1 Tax=Aspergillus pseudoviridinutans TaxID=1517512 RepID=A0A9P3ET61_9EURO|nr:uncharacterized protein Asppvi_005893 [Aspergillus pseudoviridinutans]GIJ86994.1 hypothetical protein Asppvi_005893 [Aspergillus pseudoviridinutans]